MNKKNQFFLENVSDSINLDFSNSISKDLNETIKLIYDPCSFKYNHFSKEISNKDYGAYFFKLNEFIIRFRSSKITPAKIGQFVTLWERNENGISQPYDISDSADFFVISTRKDNHFGQFIFPKNILLEQKIISNMGKGGKRGIRVYPPWDKPINSTAEKTQLWQLKYFLDISALTQIDCAYIKKLYSLP